MRTRFHLPRHLGNITQNKFSFNISRSLGGDYASNADREDQFDRYIHSADVRWNALMSGLSVLIVLGTVPDLFEMFNSIIGTFHHTCAGTLLRSSLARLRLLSLKLAKTSQEKLTSGSWISHEKRCLLKGKNIARVLQSGTWGYFRR